MKDGGRSGFGLKGGTGRIDRVGDRCPDSLLAGRWMADTFGRSFGRFGGMGGGSLAAELAAATEEEGAVGTSRNLSGLGAGETARGVGGSDGEEVPSPGLFRFSNLARREETGF